MSEQILQFVGNWEKIASNDCGQIYPASIEFLENGSYFAQNDPASSFLIWDMGSYEVIDPEHVEISLANDAVLTYTFSIDDTTLVFVDREGCEFKYQRTP
jgi:hypothetical protein